MLLSILNLNIIKKPFIFEYALTVILPQNCKFVQCAGLLRWGCPPKLPAILIQHSISQSKDGSSDGRNILQVIKNNKFLFTLNEFYLLSI